MREISSEQDAWELLSCWLQGQRVEDVVFNSWPVLQIHLKGEDYQSSLNSGQMASLVELKKVFGRGYSVIAHGSYDMRRLREEEDEALQFTTRVKKGSSILETDFTPLVKAFSQAITANPEISIISATLIGLALVARPVIIKFYENKARQLDIEERKGLLDLTLDKQEKKHFQIFEKVFHKIQSSYPQFAQVMPDTRDAFWKFASSSANAETMNIAGLQLERDDLEILSGRRARQASVKERVKALFHIKSVTSNGDSFKVVLKSNEKLINAIYRRPEMTDARIRHLTTRMVEAKPIFATVDIKVVDKSSLEGRLISFTYAKAGVDD
ncbi:hypothetical protein ACQR53_17045 [Xanthomonas oryzae]|uniref:hypothetical protein n=1 Tax=Xanthomonas oryzae TaxID=347 RepID=UPI001033E7E5|nr:hypothetical protein [Xanthomonas oryzae]QBG87061.1 hypothetical protein EYC54_03935 [Xanthomonas oryzae]